MSHFLDTISDPLVPAHTETLFSAFMDNLPVFAWIKDLEGRYLYVNKLLIAQLPSFQSRWLGKTDADLWPAEIAAAYRANDLKVITGLETLETVETSLVDGQPHTLLVSKFPILDQTGAVTMVGGTGVDITAHKRAEDALLEQGKEYARELEQRIAERERVEEALRESESFRRTIIESEPECVKLVGVDCTLLDMNPAGLAMVGATSREEVIGQSVLPLIAPEWRKSFAEMHRRVCQGESVVAEFEIIGLNGVRRWMETHAAPLRNSASGLIAQLAITRDVTERKRAEESLKLFRSLIDRSTDAIEVLEPNTLRFLDCNAFAYQSLGYTREEFLSLSAFDIDPVLDQGLAARLDEEIEKSGFVIFESVHRRKDGSTFPVEINAKIIRLERDYRLSVVRDITERKGDQEALRAAEQKYRDIFENAGEGIFQSTPEGRYISANPALAHMLGFDSPEEFIRSRTDISRETYAEPERREEFKRLLEEHGMVRGFEHQGLCKDGSRIWITVNARMVRDEHGEALYYEGTAQDITERKRVEDELIRQKEILQNIVDHIPIMINFTDGQGRVRLVNAKWQKTLGWSLEDLRSEGLEAFSACYPNPQQRQEVLDFIAAATGEWVDFKSLTRDGRQIDTSWARVRLSDGTTIGIGQDITDRKRSEQALRQAEQKYRELFENAKDAIYVHDLNGRYTSVNRAAEQLSGYLREEILGKDFSDFVAPEYLENIRENLCRKLRHHGETTYEVEAITKDRRHVPVEISSRLIYEDGVPVAVQGTARDITARKRAEEALRGYSRRLIRAQEAERQTIARELHDQIGQVLTAIRINLETIRASSNQADSHALIDEGVNIVEEASKQVRDLSFELRPSLLDDLGLNAALSWYAERYALRTGIHTHTAIGPDSRIRLPVELETACFRIVQEALTNVARHAHASHVAIKVLATDGAASLSIKDDGIGFNSQSPTNGASLNSLGLRGMEERARELGGRFEIQSAPHEGTEIRVYFPIGTRKASTEASSHESSLAGNASRPISG